MAQGLLWSIFLWFEGEVLRTSFSLCNQVFLQSEWAHTEPTNPYRQVTPLCRRKASEQTSVCNIAYACVSFDIGHILAFLKKNKPEDAFCIVGITMIDLYPRDSWNFVFGQASLSSGIPFWYCLDVVQPKVIRRYSKSRKKRSHQYYFQSLELVFSVGATHAVVGRVLWKTDGW